MSIEETFSLRRVRQLLKVLKLDDGDVTKMTNSVSRFDAKLELSLTEIQKLRHFSNDIVTKQMSHKERLGLLHDVDAILNGFIIEVTPEKEFDFLELAEDYTEVVKRYLPSSQDLFWAILIGGGLCLAYLLWIGLPIWKGFLILIVLSSLWHWGLLYKKALLKKQIALMRSSQIPHECFKQKSWFDSIFGGSQKCVEYHEALLVDPLWEVTPTMAVADTLTLMCVQPLEAIGLHLGKFFTSLLANQSWLSALPVLIFVFLVILLFIVMMFGYKIRLPFLLASIEPHPKVIDHQATKQVIMLEQKVEELQRKLELNSDVSLTSNVAERIPLRVVNSNSDEEIQRSDLQIEDTVSDKLKMEELERKISELSTTIQQLTLGQATDQVSEVVGLQAAIEVLPESHQEEKESPLHPLMEVQEPVEEVKETNPEDFEWVNTSSMIVT